MASGKPFSPSTQAMKTVSYTHLDVYKRQTVGNEMNNFSNYMMDSKNGKNRLNKLIILYEKPITKDQTI